MILKNDEKIICMHCGGEQDDTAIDYTSSRAIGRGSRCTEECGWCYKKFSVERFNEDEVMINFKVRR